MDRQFEVPTQEVRRQMTPQIAEADKSIAQGAYPSE
jgi:hypothetical protein